MRCVEAVTIQEESLNYNCEIFLPPPSVDQESNFERFTIIFHLGLKGEDRYGKNWTMGFAIYSKSH